MGDHKTETILNQKTNPCDLHYPCSKWMGSTLNGWVRDFAVSPGGVAIPSTPGLWTWGNTFFSTPDPFSWHLLMSWYLGSSESHDKLCPFFMLILGGQSCFFGPIREKTLFQEVQHAWCLWRFAASIEVSFIIRCCFGKWMQMILLSYKWEM